MAVLRNMTNQEQEHFIELGNHGPKRPTYSAKKKETIKLLETKFHKNFIPYDRKGALLDLQDTLDALRLKLQRTVNGRDELEREMAKKDIFPDSKLEAYGDIKRFTLNKITPITTEKLIDNIKQSVQDRVKVEYRQKEYGNAVLFIMSNSDFDKQFPALDHNGNKKTPAK